jgi:predicted TIM-barrel fold metal-dependent hydrolase
MAVLAAGHLFSARGVAAQDRSPPSGKGRRIDVHHHILPPAYVATVGETAIGAPAPNKATPKWTVASSLEAMDRNDIGAAVVSISAPGILLNDTKATSRLARTCNEYAAQMHADHPTRFGIFAALPLPDTKTALDELTYSFEVLKADGIGMMTNYDGRYLGDPAFAPIFDELNRRKAVVYVHPTTCKCSAGILDEQPASLIEFPHDTTRAITSLLFTGTFTRCQDIRFIFSHAGGTLPSLAYRIAGTRDRTLVSRVPGGVMPIFKRLYYDTASATNPVTLGALLKIVGPENVLLGTDFPFVPESGMKATVTELAQFGLDERALRAIEGGNAAGIFSRLSAG